MYIDKKLAVSSLESPASYNYFPKDANAQDLLQIAAPYQVYNQVCNQASPKLNKVPACLLTLANAEQHRLNLEHILLNLGYVIMFGPDKCGATNKVHFIFQHKLGAQLNSLLACSSAVNCNMMSSSSFPDGSSAGTIVHSYHKSKEPREWQVGREALANACKRPYGSPHAHVRPLAGIQHVSLNAAASAVGVGVSCMP